MEYKQVINRRQFISLAMALGAGLMLPGNVTASSSAQIRKTITKSGEKLSVIGMGTSRTFDITGDTELLSRLEQVSQTFFDMGGEMIDSSPMYGASQKVIGQILSKLNHNDQLFSATKVWIEGYQEGIEQMEYSRLLWGIKKFDLMQIHNLLDWKTHYETLQQMKAEGKIRYIGITTSHGRYHEQLKDILSNNDFDFVQLSYNIANRDVERELLPIAMENGVSVIANRPYQRGALFQKIRNKPLPEWVQEFDCTSWGQYFLKYIVSHPAITCAIPATTKVKHMKDNMLAGRGRLPTPDQRTQMLKYFESL
ncbi:MAG: aldo/keto reductase [Gammaproteobacteria bacterium]|nr:aldo/keto reductase [Gammaproteobacteria bacterium]